MASYNHVSIMGHLTRDVRFTEFDGGGCVANFGIAINEYWYDKEGDKQEKTIFVDVTAWNRQAEIAHEYLAKGSPILIHGGLDFEEWEDEETESKRTKVSIRAHRLIFVRRKDDDDDNGNGGGDRNRSSSSRSSSGSSKRNRGSSGGSNKRSTNKNTQSNQASDVDDDIPF